MTLAAPQSIEIACPQNLVPLTYPNDFLKQAWKELSWVRTSRNKRVALAYRKLISSAESRGASPSGSSALHVCLD